MKLLKSLTKSFIVVLLLLLVLPALAFGDASTSERHGLVLSQVQLYAVVVGALSPVVSYVLNAAVVRKILGKVPEPLAALVHALVAAAAASIYEAATTNSLGFNDSTLQVIGTAIAASFVAHAHIWKPAGVQAALAKPPKTRRAS